MNRCSSRPGAARRITFVCGTALLATVAVATPRPARCTVGRHLRELLHNVDAIAGIRQAGAAAETQLQQYTTQLQQYANMVTNTVALPQELWGNVQSDIMQVRNLSNAASLLSGNAGSIVTRLQSASGYASQAASLGNIANQFTTWQQTIGNNVSTLGRTLGIQQNQQANDATLLTTLQSAFAKRARPDASYPGRQRTGARECCPTPGNPGDAEYDSPDAGNRDGCRCGQARVGRRRHAALQHASTNPDFRLSTIVRHDDADTESGVAAAILAGSIAATAGITYLATKTIVR